ncbi:MAG TPA: BatA domain-containing protein, partial [Micavibrio sp.]
MMIPGLGTLAFMNPWVLAGMASLPVLWFLLRVTPPAPRLIVFPAAHFMAGLDAQKQVPSKTPWPILLLRILAAALIMLALARPVLNPGDAVSGSGPVRIVMDNGWSAAQTWRLQMAQAIDLVERTGRERRPLYIGTTAPEPGKTAPFMAGPLTKGEAEATLRGLKPHPWLSDYHAASLLFETAKDNANVQTYWLSSGQRDDVPDRLIRVLQNQGGLTFIAPAPTQRALLLRPDKSKPGQAAAIIEVNSGTPAGMPLTVQVLTRDGRQIDSRDITTDGKQISFKVAFDLPTALQNQISRLQIAGRHSAGSTLLLDSGSYRRRVGIVNTSTAEKAALADATYYIKRALEPVADIQADSLPALLEDDYSVLILPDVGAMPPEDLDMLEGWVREGGLLIRFGGPNMTQGENFLTPVSLRRGDRAMAGALSWDKPAKLAPFPARSPYYGLEIPEDLKIARQLLAEPEPELERKSWAALADGTPLITADHLDDGLIVMIHTTATPEWSNLVLSGLFVKIMERTVQMAGTQALADDNAAAGTLQPQLLLDGHGNNTQPRATDQPIPAAEFESKIPDSTHPPGLYGRVGYQKSLNLGERLPTLRTFTDMPMGVALESYGGVKEQNLMPFILAMALLLFMIDWVVMIILHAGWHLF